HAAADGRPFGDQLRRARLRYVVDAEAATDLAARGLAEFLVIDEHDAVGDAHLVRVPAVGHVDGREDLRVARVGDVDDGGAAGRAHVPDIQGRAVDPDLAAARTVQPGHQRGVRARQHHASRTTASSLVRPHFL